MSLCPTHWICQLLMFEAIACFSYNISVHVCMCAMLVCACACVCVQECMCCGCNLCWRGSTWSLCLHYLLRPIISYAKNLAYSILYAHDSAYSNPACLPIILTCFPNLPMKNQSWTTYYYCMYWFIKLMSFEWSLALKKIRQCTHLLIDCNAHSLMLGSFLMFWYQWRFLCPII